MESAVRTISEPIFDRPLREISFGTVLLRLFAALQRFDGQIQPQLILLQKTLLNVEGLGRQLYPELDIWKTAAPVLRAWRQERVGPRALLRELRRGLPDLIDALSALPALARTGIERAQDARARGPADSAGLAALRARLSADHRRRDRLLLGAVLLLGGILWVGLDIAPLLPGPLLIGAGLLAMASARWRERSG